MITATDFRSCKSLTIKDSESYRNEVTAAICGPRGGDQARIWMTRAELVKFAREILAAYDTPGD